jgi:hypothetical protein
MYDRLEKVIAQQSSTIIIQSIRRLKNTRTASS